MKKSTIKIGKQIRQWRKGARLTQSDLGKLIGRTTETVCRYEKDKIDIPMSVYWKIQEVCERLSK